MSFNNLYYDQGAYVQSLNQSVGPGVYLTGQPKISCESCFRYDPAIRIQTQGDSISSNQSLIDVDSELMNITRKHSKDPKMKYIPSCPNSMCSSGEVCGQGVVGSCSNHKFGERFGDNNLKHFKDCANQITTEDARLSNPPCNLRGSGWNRWEWLCHDPQERVEVPFDWNISNRLLAKDNHRPVIPRPIDPHYVMPLGGSVPCDMTSSTCSSYTTPSDVHWQSAKNIRRY